nr:hypothetical protein [Prauserella sp. PE36]
MDEKALAGALRDGVIAGPGWMPTSWSRSSRTASRSCPTPPCCRTSAARPGPCACEWPSCARATPSRWRRAVGRRAR